MKKFILFLIPLFLIISCKFDDSDPIDSFPVKDYSSLVKEDKYAIPSSAEAIVVFNLIYNEFGYGEHEITQGSGVHTESKTVLGEKITKTDTCEIKKIKVYHVDNSTSGMHVSSFYVDLINEKNEILQYCYEWQYHIDNAWKNTKTSKWHQTEAWYKSADDKTRVDWNLTINKQ